MSNSSSNLSELSMLKCSCKAKSMFGFRAFFFILGENIIYDRNQTTYLNEYFCNSVHVDFYSFAVVHWANGLY